MLHEDISVYSLILCARSSRGSIAGRTALRIVKLLDISVPQSTFFISILCIYL